MRKLPLIFIALLALIFISACGQSAEDKKAEEDRQVAAAAKKKEEARVKKVGETGKLCDELVSGLRDAVVDLNSRLDVGIKPDDYSSRLGDISVAYNKTNWDDTPNVYCLKEVGVPLETAYQDFTDAGTVWNDCISDVDCDVEEDKLPEMQKKWTHAGEMIDQSNTKLEDFQLDD